MYVMHDAYHPVILSLAKSGILGTILIIVTDNYTIMIDQPLNFIVCLRRIILDGLIQLTGPSK